MKSTPLKKIMIIFLLLPFTGFKIEVLISVGIAITKLCSAVRNSLVIQVQIQSQYR